jgi:T-complex protein 1 subunit theta
MMHALHASHEGANTQNMGFSLDTTAPADAVAAGVYDVYATKVNALRLAVDAAMTVLKVDQIVMSKPAGGPKPKQGPQDAD